MTDTDGLDDSGFVTDQYEIACTECAFSVTVTATGPPHDEFTSADDRPWQTLDHYIILTGTVHPDRDGERCPWQGCDGTRVVREQVGRDDDD